MHIYKGTAKIYLFLQAMISRKSKDSKIGNKVSFFAFYLQSVFHSKTLILNKMLNTCKSEK